MQKGKKMEQSVKEQYQQEKKYRECKFDYERVLFQQHMAEKQVADFWLSLKADGVLLFAMIILKLFAMQCEKNVVLRVIAGLCEIVQVILLIMLVYALWKIRFGLVYKKRKRHLELAQDTVVYYASCLCQMEQKMETLQDIQEETSFSDREQVEKEEQIYSARTRRLRNERLDREYEKICREIELLNSEEDQLKAKINRHGKITLSVTAVLLMGIACYPYITLFSQLVVVVLFIVLPVVLWMPFFVLWSKEKIEWLLGEDYWINKNIFVSLYQVSIQQRRLREVQKLEECKRKIMDVEE